MTEIKDLSKATGKESCIYTKYEKDRLTHLRKELTNAVSIQGEILITAENKLYESRMAKAIDNMFAKMDSCFSDIDDKGGSIQETIDEVKLSCVKLLQIIEELELPKAKPRCCDLSDAGPGVGVSNLEVRFRDAEICRMFGSDYRIRLHRSRGDSGQGESERTNSAISDAVVDGATINWEKIKQFDGLTTEEVKKLSVREFEQIEETRLQQNAWEVAKELVERIDGAPVMGEMIKAYLLEDENQLFFFNQQYLAKYQSVSSQTSKDQVPGAAYFNKIMKFFNCHYKIGELFIEFLKFSCASTNAECDFCRTWTGTPIKRIPQPYPDHERHGHYMTVSETPLENEDGSERQPDDWQPRENITRLFNNSELSLTDQDKISDFASRYYVKREYVVNYIQHVTNLQLGKEIRSRERKRKQTEKRDKLYGEYNWLELILKGELEKLNIQELDKYLDKNQLSKKDDKIRAITADVLRKNARDTVEYTIGEGLGKIPTNNEEPIETSDASDAESDSDSDLVIDAIGNESSDSDDDYAEEDGIEKGSGPLPLVVQTRYGRHAGSWNLYTMR